MSELEEKENVFDEAYFDMHLKALYDCFTRFADDEDIAPNFPYTITYKGEVVGMKTLEGMDWDLPADGYDTVLNALEDGDFYIDDFMFDYLLNETSDENRITRFLTVAKEEILKGEPVFKWNSSIPESTEQLEPIEEKEEPTETYNPIEDREPSPELGVI